MRDDADLIPEERDARYQPLITALRNTPGGPVILSETEQTAIVARARARLTQRIATARTIEDTPAPRRVPAPRGRAREPYLQPNRLWAAYTVTIALVIALVAVFLNTKMYASTKCAQTCHALTTGPSAQAQVDGLRAALRITTPGPYFLSELVAVDVNVTNKTGRVYTLDGQSKPDTACGSSALYAQIGAGSAPTYTFPQLEVSCLQSLPMTIIDPGRTLTIHEYLPITKSGAVTVTMSGMVGSHQSLPLDGRWPSVTIQVATQTPADRVITLQTQGIGAGVHILIQAPSGAQGHLLYMMSYTCAQSGSGPFYPAQAVGSTQEWSPPNAPPDTLAQPGCVAETVSGHTCPQMGADSRSGTPIATPVNCPPATYDWRYVVAAPGYAIAAGEAIS
jgi:hypothetical protein